MKIEIKNDELCISFQIYIYNEGSKITYRNNKRHRDDGPAVEYHDGNETWRFEGELHRKYGPARKWEGGNDEWWLNGKKHTQEFMERFYEDCDRN